MKNILLIPLIFLISSCGIVPKRATRSNVAVKDTPYFARGANGSLKKRIMILPFLDEKLQRSQKVRDVARKALVRELLRTRNFVIIRNDDFPQDIAKFLTEDNEYDLKKIAKVAAGIGVSSVIEGKILEVRAKRLGDQVGLFREITAKVDTSVRIRMVSSKNSQIVLNDVRKASVEAKTTRVAEYSFTDRYLEEDPKLVRQVVVRAFRGAIGNIIRAVDKINWEGRVAMVTGDRIFLNAGRLSGIQIGDILKVTDEGKEVFDPDSGLFIGFAPGRMKGTLEVISYFGKDGAISLVHSGSGFQENDRVEIY
jgi:hypothetical protein